MRTRVLFTTARYECYSLYPLLCIQRFRLILSLLILMESLSWGSLAAGLDMAASG